MTKSEFAVLNRAITLLGSLTGEPYESYPAPRSCGVTQFVREYLMADPTSDVSCAEAWSFFSEVAASGALAPVGKAIFLRRLPRAVEALFNARKCHHIVRSGRRVRGFRGVGIRLNQ